MKKIKLNKWLVAVGIIGSLLAGSRQAQATAVAAVVYNNSDINDSININGYINGWDITSHEVSDSFTVSSPASLSSAVVGLWVAYEGVPYSLEWSIGTTPYDNSIGSGSVSIGSGTLDNTFLLENGDAFVYRSSFPITGSVNTGITYWFTLRNAVGGDSPTVGWDENDGPSLAVTRDPTSIGSQAFQLLGFSSTVPDQSSTLLLLGLSCLPLIGFSKRTLRCKVRECRLRLHQNDSTKFVSCSL